MVASGGTAITTTTTHIFGPQIALAPAHVPAADATRERILAALAAHRHVLVIGPADRAHGQGRGDLSRALPAAARVVPGRVHPERGGRLPHAPVQGPRRARAGHPRTRRRWSCLVVGADVFGKPMDADHVHRPELVSALAGAPLGAPMTPAVVARVLAHPDGGRKGAPPGARIVAMINKVDALADRAPALETAGCSWASRRSRRWSWRRCRGDEPVIEVCTR